MSLYGKTRRFIKDIHSIGISLYRSITNQDVIYPTRVAREKARATNTIPRPNYSGKVKTGPVPHGVFGNAFYNSGIGQKAKPGEKFAYLRKAYMQAKLADKIDARKGVISDHFGRVKHGVRLAAVVMKSFYNVRRTQIGIGNLLSKYGGSIGATINKYVKNATLSYYRRALKSQQNHPDLKFSPYSHTNNIREQIGVARLGAITVGSGLLAYGAYRGVKALLSRSEKNKRISIGLLKSNKMKHK